jgi:hypothetical protein
VLLWLGLLEKTCLFGTVGCWSVGCCGSSTTVPAFLVPFDIFFSFSTIIRCFKVGEFLVHAVVNGGREWNCSGPTPGQVCEAINFSIKWYKEKKSRISE